MLMRKTIKNRCEYLNRAGSRPRKYEKHVGMYWSVQNKGFFLSQERAKNERRKNSVEATGHGCSCGHTCLFADFCDFTVTTTRRKSVPFVTSVD